MLRIRMTGGVGGRELKPPAYPIVMFALAWAGWLRREVSRRGMRIAEEISARREAELEYKTTLRERSRLATDLHDTLEQTLTGVSLQLQATELFRGDDPVRSAAHLRLAQQFLDRSREDMHRTVWDLRAHGLDGRGIVETVRERVGGMLAGSSIRFTVEGDGQNQDLPDFIAGNLLLLAQEAITNALKHAAPERIDVRIDFRADGVSLRVTDDGCGFDPACAPGHRDGHFGLQGMRERVKRVGGLIEIASEPGGGCRIEVEVPSAAFEDAPGL